MAIMRIGLHLATWLWLVSGLSYGLDNTRQMQPNNQGLVLQGSSAYVISSLPYRLGGHLLRVTKGSQHNFQATAESSDVPLLGVPSSEALTFFSWPTPERIFSLTRLSSVNLFSVYVLDDYPLFDSARNFSDGIFWKGERGLRGESIQRTPEQEKEMQETIRKAINEGKTLESSFGGQSRRLFDEMLMMMRAIGKIPREGALNEISPSKSFALATKDDDSGFVVLLSQKGVVVYVPYSCKAKICSTQSTSAESVAMLPEAELVFLSADRHIGVATADKLLVYTRSQDGWANTATEEGFAATACIWDWDTDEFLLVDKGGEKFYRLGGTEADKPKPAGRIDDAARQQTLKNAWAITKLPATRPE